jgi:LysM repeat protein/predicted deacylase
MPGNSRRSLWLVLSASLFLASCRPAVQQGAQPVAASLQTVAPTETEISELQTTAPTLTLSLMPVATETPMPETPTPLPTETPAPRIHVVQAGENLSIIAQKFGTTITAVQVANGLENANNIHVGQELVIPPAAGENGSTPDASVNQNPDTPPERDVLANYVLCPAEEDIAPEGDVTLGHSAVCGIPIIAYQLGQGETLLIIAGGIHGGYEWNTILLAYSFLDYLQENPEVIPPALTVHLIPNANPDGLYAVTRRIGRFTAADVDEDSVSGRFNGNYVDLNRNWDCNWTPNATWRDNPISGGSEPFSELENQALRDFALSSQPVAAVFLHSAARAVFASGCGQIDPASMTLAEVYSGASGYPLYDTFHHYDITGDAADWLASQGIPSISVELTDHESLDWAMNRAGLLALMNYLAVTSN